MNITTWQIQKNCQNNEKKLFAKNLHDNQFYSIASMQHIIDQVCQHGVPEDEPLKSINYAIAICKGRKLTMSALTKS
jgi:hypothetical protein